MTPPTPDGMRLRWEDGLQLVDSVLWFDAPRQRELCFLSHAAVEPLPGHHKVLATPQTFALAGERLEGAERLPCPTFRPFFLGELELELLPSGYLAGAALLAVRRGGQSLLYARDFAPVAAPGAEPLRVRRCDVLALHCPAEPQPGPSRAEQEQLLLAFAGETLAMGRPVVLLINELAVARGLIGLLEPTVATLLAPLGGGLRAHRSLLRWPWKDVGPALPVSELRGAPRPGQIVLWPAVLAPRLPTADELPPPRVALVGNRPHTSTSAQSPRLLPFRLAAAGEELLDLVRAASPGRVVLWGPGAAECGERVAKLGVEQELLRTPEQRSLPY